MKKQILLLIALIMLAAPAYAVEFVAKRADGSFIYNCRPSSSIKVKVKLIGPGLYKVISAGGIGGYSGNVLARNDTYAAQYGCGEKKLPPKPKE
ncbi:MAG: hypothetical protein QNL04_03955 [SAR324 cluster bacterium]|nr:hypothetical protein [SAR324 cluster bacterium]